MGGARDHVGGVHGRVRRPGAGRVATRAPRARHARAGGPVDRDRVDPRDDPARRVRLGAARRDPGRRPRAAARVHRRGVGAVLPGDGGRRPAPARVGAVGEWSPGGGTRPCRRCPRPRGGARVDPDPGSGRPNPRRRHDPGRRRLGPGSRRGGRGRRGRPAEHRPPSRARGRSARPRRMGGGSARSRGHVGSAADDRGEPGDRDRRRAHDRRRRHRRSRRHRAHRDARVRRDGKDRRPVREGEAGAVRRVRAVPQGARLDLGDRPGAGRSDAGHRRVADLDPRSPADRDADLLREQLPVDRPRDDAARERASSSS